MLATHRNGGGLIPGIVRLAARPCSVDTFGATAGFSSVLEPRLGKASRGTRHFRSVGALGTDCGCGASTVHHFDRWGDNGIECHDKRARLLSVTC